MYLLTGSDSKAHLTRASVPTLQVYSTWRARLLTREERESESLWRRPKDQLTISVVFEAARKRSRGGEPTQEVLDSGRASSHPP